MEAEGFAFIVLAALGLACMIEGADARVREGLSRMRKDEREERRAKRVDWLSMLHTLNIDPKSDETDVQT